MTRTPYTPGSRQAKAEAPTGVPQHNLIHCPFCDEDDFDLIGLKGHLQHGDCDIYETLVAPVRIFHDNMGERRERFLKAKEAKR